MKRSPIEFFVAGEPIAQPRHRIGKGRAYLPHDKVAAVNRWKACVRAAYLNAVKAAGRTVPEVRITGPVRLDLCFLLPRPKRLRGKERVLAATAAKDFDNLAKAVADALNCFAFDDDRRVVRSEIYKFFAAEGEQPGCRVLIEELSK